MSESPIIPQPLPNISSFKIITLFGKSVNLRTTLGVSVVPFVRSTRAKLMSVVTHELLVILGMIVVAAVVASPRELLMALLLASVASVVPNVGDLLTILTLAATTTMVCTAKEFFIVFSFSLVTATVTSTQKFLGIFVLASTVASFLGVQETVIIFAVSSVAVAITGIKQFLLLFGITGVFAAITGAKEFLVLLFLTIAIASLLMLVQAVFLISLYLFNTLVRLINRLFSFEFPLLFVLLCGVLLVGSQAASRIAMALLATEKPYIIALTMVASSICIIAIVKAKLLLPLTAVTASLLL
ncbi:hypothetical protein K493DRAFT_308357 [Basidiobolus meristosporus CBS 931.73]|uniref:Uncharacterized protein n=1 Tax=Basidiobolus meristosporus CBS 931.73 TaxID=1314790 RepID=A0A1Y1X408_9FUNG|nr:hypothetical protein K493DRAFT_308357 [Basidiobolus meristosporus CBS 931.73]|eukprot:ORX80385.1 hypothetical protein K493DRAFT_308357 [Basidiobolus meristosporus CBS 931.73]